MCPIDVWEMESQSPITFTHSSFSARVQTFQRLTLAHYGRHRLDTEGREGTLPSPGPPASALLNCGLAVGHLLLLLLLHVLLVVVVEALLLWLILVDVVVPSRSRDLASKLSDRRGLKLLLWLLLLRLLWLLLCLPSVGDAVVHDQFWAGDYPDGDYNSV